MGQRRESLFCRERRRSGGLPRGGMPCCYVLPDATRCTSHILPTAWPSGDHAAPHGRAAHHPASTSKTRWPSAWWPGCRAAGLRRPVHGRQQRSGRQHRAGPQDGPRVGMSDKIGPWPGDPRGRCSWARTSCTPATTPSTPVRSSTTRWRSSCGRRSTGPRDAGPHRGGLDAVARALLDEEHRRETVGRWSIRLRPTCHEHGVKTCPIFVPPNTARPDRMTSTATGGQNGDRAPDAPVDALADLSGEPRRRPRHSRRRGQPRQRRVRRRQPADPTQTGSDGRPTPWPPRREHWPTSPSPIPAQPAPNHWPKQSPWPPLRLPGLR